LSSADWTTFNNKQNSLTLTTTGSSGDATLVGATLNIPNYTLAGLGGVPTSRTLTINGTTFDLSANRTWSVGTVTSVAALTIGTSGTDLSSTVANGTTTPVITLNVPTASATNGGALSSTDWTTFNNKQNALTNPITGISASGRVAYFNGDTSITGSSNFFWDSTNNRLGIGLNNPQRTLEIHNATADSQLRISGAAPSVSLGEAITGAIYQAKFGLITANGQYVTGGVAGDFVMISQTGATIFATSSTEKMRVQASGNVSIGNTNDTFRLDVSGTLRATGAATFSSSVTSTLSSGIFLNNSSGGTNATQIRISNTGGDARMGVESSTGGTIQIGTSAYSAVFGNQANAATEFTTNGTVRMSITSGGNVGIGTTSPVSLLQVNGESRIIYSKAVASNPLDVSSFSGLITVNTNNINGSLSGIAMYANSDYNAAAGIFASRTSGTSADMVFYAGSATAGERMRITSGGNVVMGNNAGSGWATSSTRTTLEIYGGGFPMALHNSTSVGNSISYNTYWDGANWRYVGASSSVIYIQDSEGHKFLHNGTGTAGASFTPTERMRITSGGAVQIQQTIQTGAPANGTAQPWKLGNAVSGTVSPSHYLVVEINGQSYTINAFNGFP
jgi:hypothetical protein